VTTCWPSPSAPDGGEALSDSEHARPNAPFVRGWRSHSMSTSAPGQPAPSVWYVMVSASAAWPWVGESPSEEVALARPADHVDARTTSPDAATVRHADRVLGTTLHPSEPHWSAQQSRVRRASPMDLPTPGHGRMTMSDDVTSRRSDLGIANELRRARQLPARFGGDHSSGGLAVDPRQVRVEPRTSVGKDQGVLARAALDQASRPWFVVREWSCQPIVEVHVRALRAGSPLRPPAIDALPRPRTTMTREVANPLQQQRGCAPSDIAGSGAVRYTGMSVGAS
jgi:hypothetical protein